MMKRRIVLHIAASLMAAILSLPAAYIHAQVTPPSPGLMQSNGPLSAVDREQITLFVSHYLRQLATAATNPRADQLISEARTNLVRPTNGPVSAWWLNTYSQLMQDGLNGLINSGEPLHRVNALIVTGELGSDTAVTILLRQLNDQSMPVRLWAANGLATAFRKADRGAIGTASTTRAARDVARAAESETNGIVFRKQLQAIAAAQIAAAVTNNPVNADQIRTIRLETAQKVLQQLREQDAPSSHLIAIYETLNQIRSEFLQMPSASQRQIGPLIVQVCYAVFEVAGAHWNAVHGANPSAEATMLRPRYAEVLEFCESFVTFTDDVVRSGNLQPARPRRGLAQAWRNGNQSEYGTLRTAWRDFILQVQVYRPQ